MMPPARLVVWLCARQELQLAVRSRWTQTFTAVFAILALAVAASGYVLSGGSGMQDFARTGASLVQLVLLLVPLTALVFGVLAITPEAGAAELIFSQPVARKTILAGRFLGVFIALVAAQSIGFGAAGLVLFLRTGQDGLAGFAGIVAGAIVLTGVFLGIAAVVAAGDAGPRRARNLAAALVVWFLNVAMGAIALPLWKRLAPYQQNRLLTFLNPEVDPRAAGYHAIQSRVAIGSGGWFGTGYTEGPQKRLAFLPEQHTDFVFPIVGEELGFVGVLAALALFLALFLVLLRIARRATDSFSSLVIFGIMGLMFTHVYENIGMTVNLMPITGIPLPFFSYGGSFFVICCLCLGLAFRVANDSRQSGYPDV